MRVIKLPENGAIWWIRSSLSRW